MATMETSRAVRDGKEDRSRYSVRHKHGRRYVEEKQMKYRVEVVQTTVLFIEADSPEEAQDIATGDYIWDEDQTAPNRYGVHFNIEEL